jgi:hypothetical protein
VPKAPIAQADWVGLALLTAALVVLTPLIEGQQEGWPWQE